MSKYHSGGCNHIETLLNGDPIDSHICHCSVCKRVTGRNSTHVVFAKYADMTVSDESRINRQPFNNQNPDGPLELCTCADCGTPIMLNDKHRRIRVIVPNLMGYDPTEMPATYHAFFDDSSGDAKPNDGLPVYESLRPDFVWPDSQ